jgi:uncharacterized membrane protein YgcG
MANASFTHGFVTYMAQRRWRLVAHAAAVTTMVLSLWPSVTNTAVVSGGPFLQPLRPVATAFPTSCGYPCEGLNDQGEATAGAPHTDKKPNASGSPTSAHPGKNRSGGQQGGGQSGSGIESPQNWDTLSPNPVK